MVHIKKKSLKKNCLKKKTVAILISDKIDFKAHKIIRDREGNYIMQKGHSTEKI